MLAPQACVAVEVAGPPAAQEQRAALERRCSEILGPRRCRIVAAMGEGESACWHARVTAEGGDPPIEASVVLADETEPAHAPVRRDITFRPNDAVVERWATLGLVIAALVTVEEHSAAEAAPAATPGPENSGFVPVVESPAPAPPAEPIEGEVRASGVVAFGFLPAAAFGARLEASLARGHLAGLARGTIYPAETRATFGAGGAGGDVQLWSAGLGLCGRGEAGAWGLRACAGGDLARMSASGVGVAETNSAAAWWEAIWVGASGALRVAEHLALTLEIEGAVVLQRPTFAIHGRESTFTPAPVGGAIALGLAVLF